MLFSTKTCLNETLNNIHDFAAQNKCFYDSLNTAVILSPAHDFFCAMSNFL